MKLAGYDLIPIETGRFALDGGAMFGIIPRPLWEKNNPPDARNRITLAARALLLVGNGRKILIDNGNGSKFTDKQKDIYRLETTESELINSLAMRGFGPEDITDVLLTHLHFDHAGGSTTFRNGELVPTFPNATYYVQRAHWENALNPSEKDRGSFMPDDFMPLKKHDRLHFVDGEGMLFPHIEMILVNGHTMAQQLPLITDGKTALLYSCDLFPTVNHIPLPYIMAYDCRPLVTLEEKKRILARALANNWTLFFEHDPNTVAGTIRQTEKGYAFAEAVEL
jgi:glyoxylase-like metal-dependent hydrolase (beta-lactamase superfamily II)